MSRWRDLSFTPENRTDLTLIWPGSFAHAERSASQGSQYHSLRSESQLLTEVPTRSPNNQSAFRSKDFLHNLHLVRADRPSWRKTLFFFFWLSFILLRVSNVAFSPSIEENPPSNSWLPRPFFRFTLLRELHQLWWSIRSSVCLSPVYAWL